FFPVRDLVISDAVSFVIMQYAVRSIVVCHSEYSLGLLLKHVKEKNFCHFPTTQKRAAEVPSLGFPTEKCAEALEILQREFQVRFQELHAHAKDIRLFQSPFAADIDCIDPIYQLELAELQNFDNLKDAFKSSTLVDFYASLPGETYPNLKKHALKMTTIFGSTYICEQTFSRMKQLKCRTRSNRYVFIWRSLIKKKASTN
uniref:HAT C-terminal dimerisation domain-containing protein n=1 Tax=Astyanax mexicanus TaxID=7994 RepID=A0A3B1KEN9_ASTMX